MTIVQSRNLSSSTLSTGATMALLVALAQQPPAVDVGTISRTIDDHSVIISGSASSESQILVQRRSAVDDALSVELAGLFESMAASQEDLESEFATAFFRKRSELYSLL